MPDHPDYTGVGGNPIFYESNVYGTPATLPRNGIRRLVDAVATIRWLVRAVLSARFGDVTVDSCDSGKVPEDVERRPDSLPATLADALREDVHASWGAAGYWYVWPFGWAYTLTTSKFVTVSPITGGR